MRDAFCRVCERFPGYTFEMLAEEDEDQISAKLDYIGEYPTSSTRMVEWGKDGR